MLTQHSESSKKLANSKLEFAKLRFANIVNSGFSSILKRTVLTRRATELARSSFLTSSVWNSKNSFLGNLRWHVSTALCCEQYSLNSIHRILWILSESPSASVPGSTASVRLNTVNFTVYVFRCSKCWKFRLTTHTNSSSNWRFFSLVNLVC